MQFNEKDSSKICAEIVRLSTHKGRLDLDEMDKRLAQFVADKLMDQSSLHFQEYPAEPKAMTQFKQLTKDQQYKYHKNNPEWTKDPTIVEYFDKRSRAQNCNQANVDWLTSLAGCVGDESRSTILSQRAKEIHHRMPRQQYVASKPTQVMPEPYKDDVADTLKELFDGTLTRKGTRRGRTTRDTANTD